MAINAIISTQSCYGGEFMLEYRFSTQQHSKNLFYRDMVPRLVYVHDIVALQPSLTQMHSHTQYLELLHITKGCVIFEINRQQYRLNKGDTIVINPQQLHRIVSSEGSISAISLGINSLQIQDLAPNYLLPLNHSPVIPPTPAFKNITAYFELCKSLALAGADEVLNNNPQTSLLNSLIVTLYNLSKIGHKEDKRPLSLAEKIKIYLDAHYLENITLDNISHAMHLNRFYLSHIFKEHMGVSPIQYVNKRRISEAQLLLISTDLSITEIAFRCGFNNSNYFQTFFKKSIGMTPGKYRKVW